MQNLKVEIEKRQGIKKRLSYLINGIFGGKKLWQKEGRCPYGLCPTNQPFFGAREARMKFMQMIGPSVYQFKCKDCGNLTNFCVEAVQDHKAGVAHQNPSLVGGKPSFTFFRGA